MSDNNQTAIISFHGQELITVEQDGIIYVAMKPICEGMGLAWEPQRRKIFRSERYDHMIIPLQTPGGIQEMLCIPLTKLNGWLFSVNPVKVRIEIRITVELYQEECFVVLYDYWHKGVATNPRKNLPQTETRISIANDILPEISAAMKVVSIFGFEGNQAILSANRMVRNVLSVDCLDLMGQKALICEKQEHHLTPTEIGKMLGGISARKVNQQLAEAGIIESYKDAKNRPRWKATEKGRKHTILKDTAKRHTDGTPIQQMFFLESVISILKESNA